MKPAEEAEHVAQGERRTAEQEQRIIHLGRSGHPEPEARKLLHCSSSPATESRGRERGQLRDQGAAEQHERADGDDEVEVLASHVALPWRAAAIAKWPTRRRSRLAGPSPATRPGLCPAVIGGLALCASWHPIQDDRAMRSSV